jgi:hypothetical protein
MSADYVGGSGSSYGGSSSGSSGGGSALTQSILSSVALAGENVAVAATQPLLNTRPQYAPLVAPTPVLGLGNSTKSLWLIVIVAIIGIFAYREL